MLSSTSPLHCLCNTWTFSKNEKPLKVGSAAFFKNCTICLILARTNNTKKIDHYIGRFSQLWDMMLLIFGAVIQYCLWYPDWQAGIYFMGILVSFWFPASWKLLSGHQPPLLHCPLAGSPTHLHSGQPHNRNPWKLKTKINQHVNISRTNLADWRGVSQWLRLAINYKIYYWRIRRRVSDTAGLENILEEVLTQCLFACIILELMVCVNLSWAGLVFICPVGSRISSFHPYEGESSFSLLHWREGCWFIVYTDLIFAGVLILDISRVGQFLMTLLLFFFDDRQGRAWGRAWGFCWHGPQWGN